MVEVRAREGDRFVARPPPAIRLFLIFGPDAGTVSERADALVDAALAGDSSRTVVRLTADELAADPGRLSDEANAGSLFGGDPVIRVAMADARANPAPAVRPLIDTPPDAALVVIEAGDLKKSNPLRALLKAVPHAAVIPCYEPEPRDIAALARDIAARTDNTILPAALEQLSHRLGTDRLVARRELEKLCIYAGPGTTITGDDIAAVLGESASVAADRLVDNALLGRVEEIDTDLTRLRMEQAPLAGVAARGVRMLIDLQVMREAADAGAPLAGVIAGARPPLFFKRRAAVEAILRRWPVAELHAARGRLHEAVAAARRRPELENALVTDALLGIALRGMART